MQQDLQNLTLQELKDIAKEKGIKNISKYRKQELIDLIEKADATANDTRPSEDQDSQKKGTRKESPDNGTKEGKAEDNKQVAAEEKTDAPQSGSVFRDSEGNVLKERIRPRNGGTEDRDSRDSKDSERHEKEIVEELKRKVYENNERKAVSEVRQDIPRNEEEKSFPPDVTDVTGVLEIQETNNFGFLRGNNYLTSPEDVYVSPAQIRRFHLKTGDEITGKTKPARESERFKPLIYVDKVNGDAPDKAIRRKDFDTLIPIYPDERMYFEVPGKNDLTSRMMDIICPIGKGQRGLIVAPPKAGKTTILKKIAQNLRANYSDLKLIVLLIDERPEEVTDMKESIDGDVIYSTFDEEPQNHTKVANMVLDRAKRLVEHGKDVVILLDSITRLSRAYNLTVTPSGRTLSGGLDPAALLNPKKFFGAARNIRGGGSLTILATALVDTGSKMDDMIFEEFKGTGNMEVHLDRKLQERRIFPAIDIYRSGTRKEELLFTDDEMEAARKIRASLHRGADVGRITEDLISILANTKTNKDLVQMILKRNFAD